MGLGLCRNGSTVSRNGAASETRVLDSRVAYKMTIDHIHEVKMVNNLLSLFNKFVEVVLIRECKYCKAI